MISKKYIKELGFESIEEVFAYITLSEINGQYKQFGDLIKKLSNSQFEDFIYYLGNDIVRVRETIHWRLN